MPGTNTPGRLAFPQQQASLESRLTAVERQLAAEVGPWVALTLGPKVEENATQQQPAARLEAGGASMRLRGGTLIRTGDTLVAGEALFTLPEDSLPPGKITFSCRANSLPALLSISTAGVASLLAELPAGTGPSLDGLTFNLK